MTILDFFKTVHPSVLASKMIFKYLQVHHPIRKISDIADTTSGGTPNRGMVEYYNGDIPWVKSGELKDGLITFCDEYITEAGLKNSSAKLFPKGTLLVAMYGANIGKTGVLDFDAATNQAVCAIFSKVDVTNEFLFWYFKQQRIDFIAIGKGGAQPNISQTIINNASIVVPDGTTQQKIVDFLNAIENGKGIDRDFFIPDVLPDIERIYKYKNNYIALTESFETQLTQIESLNQAILQEAVQGKLVPQDPNDEPASELLKRIKAEKEKSGKKEKPLPPIKPEEIPFELPESWVWCRMNEICNNITDGTHQTPKYFKEGIVFLSSKNVTSGKIDWFDIKYIDQKQHEEMQKRVSPKLNDILLAKNGTTGVAALVDREIDFDIYVSLALLRPIQGVYPPFLLHFINSIVAKRQFNKRLRGIGVPNLHLNQIREVLVPLPPLNEQIRIVPEIEKQLAKTKQLKETIISNQLATEQLLKALLHEAFVVEETVTV